jgi:hypothetical protein
MPRYYFHIRRRTLALDTEGVVLADDAEAWKQATTACGEMMRDLMERSSAVPSGAWKWSTTPTVTYSLSTSGEK